MLPLALTIAANPPAVIAVVLMLSAPESRTSAVWFTLGWIVGLALVATGVILVGDAISLPEGPSPWLAGFKFVVGIALVAFGVWKWAARPSSDEPVELPAWMEALGGLSPARSFRFAALFAGLNPKTLALNVAGAVVIAEVVHGGGPQAIAIVLFVSVSSFTLVVPLAYALLARERASATLGRFQGWLTANNQAIAAGVLGLLGVMVTIGAAQDLWAVFGGR